MPTTEDCFGEELEKPCMMVPGSKEGPTVGSKGGKFLCRLLMAYVPNHSSAGTQR